METIDREKIKKIIHEFKLFPKKRLGQNFLIDEEVLQIILNSAALDRYDNIVEIGPGLGVLTEKISNYAELVLAIEKDFELSDFLRKKFKSDKNIKIIHSDILLYDISQLPKKYKIVANLPYNITSPFLKKILEASNKPQNMTLMVQKEVAERLTAKVGSSDRGILTVMIELYGEAKLTSIVKKDSFYPVPEVDSAIINIVLNKDIPKDFSEISFMRFVKIGFSQKRRQIHHPLIDGLKLSKIEILDILNKASIESNLRAEDLSINDWIKLYDLFKKSLDKNSK